MRLDGDVGRLSSRKLSIKPQNHQERIRNIFFLNGYALCDPIVQLPTSIGSSSQVSSLRVDERFVIRQALLGIFQPTSLLKKLPARNSRDYPSYGTTRCPDQYLWIKCDGRSQVLPWHLLIHLQWQLLIHLQFLQVLTYTTLLQGYTSGYRLQKNISWYTKAGKRVIVMLEGCDVPRAWYSAAHRFLFS